MTSEEFDTEKYIIKCYLWIFLFPRLQHKYPAIFHTTEESKVLPKEHTINSLGNL